LIIHSAYNSPVIFAGRLFYCTAAKKNTLLSSINQTMSCCWSFRNPPSAFHVYT